MSKKTINKKAIQEIRREASAGAGNSNKHQRPRKALLLARISSTGRAAVVHLDQLFGRVIRLIEGRQFELPDFESVVHAYEHPNPANTRVFTAKGMRAVLIIGKDCDILLSLASARKVNPAGDNAFVRAFIEVLDTGDYDRVVSTEIARLCRNTVLAGRIKQVLELRRTIIQAGPYEVEVWNLSGDLNWTLLVWVAQLEAQQIEARLTAGKIAQAERGEWNFGFAPPPGWRRLPDKTVAVDQASADAVRFVIGQVLDGETNWRELAREVTRRWPELEARRGGGKLADTQEPGTNLRRAYLNETWFEAYVSNQHEVIIVPDSVKQQLDLAMSEGRGLDSVDILEMVSSVVFDLPPQPEPIATRQEIEALKQLLEQLDGERSSSRRSTPGLWSGLRWPAEQVEFEDGSVETGLPKRTEAA